MENENRLVWNYQGRLPWWRLQWRTSLEEIAPVAPSEVAVVELESGMVAVAPSEVAAEVWAQDVH